MSTATADSPWATKAEASAQQVRRFSQYREAPFEELPPLPPLVRAHPDTTAAVPLTRPRASTAEAERQSGDDLAIPSVSTLNREFNRLSQAYAGMREESTAAPAVGTGGLLNAANTHCAGRVPRRTSAPVVPRPSLPLRSRPDSGVVSHHTAAGAPPISAAGRGNADIPDSAHDSTKRDNEVDERKEKHSNSGSVATPLLPPPRRTSLGASELLQPLPPLPPTSHASTPFRRRDSNAPPPHVEANMKSSLPSLRLETHTSVLANTPLRVESPEARVANTSASPPAGVPTTASQHPPPFSPVDAGETNRSNLASPGEENAELNGEAADSKNNNNSGSPLPHNPRKKLKKRASDANVTSGSSPAPQGRGKGRDGRIMVVVRKRPLTSDEPGPDCVQVNGPHVRIAVTKQRVDLSSYEENSDYTFDHAFDATASNADVYNTSVKDLLTVSLAGGSTSCFAYGQTGSGKTYTMMGTDGESGLYLLAAGDLFGRLSPTQQLCVCFYEIYCNSLFDLLNRRHPIVLREDANRRVNICGVVWRTVSTVAELWQLVRAGMEQRRTGSTSANEHSSRSHAILSIRIKDTAHLDFEGSVNFVDLAGSERAADTAANDRLTRLEGAEINKSLLALKECIRALDEKKKHVPFRGSRLTEVLRDSFTGNSKTVMVATVSPSSHNHEHSNNTLRYAFRVKGLSIASVEPSKARNAPRPYIPVARSRSTVGAEEKANGSPAPTRQAKRATKGGEDYYKNNDASPSRGDGGREGVTSPSKQQRRDVRKRRQSRRKSRTGSSAGDDATDGVTTNAADNALQELAEMMELNSMAELRARRASQQRRGGSSAGRNGHAAHRPNISSLLPHNAEHQQGGEGVEDAALSPSSRRRHQRRTYKAPPVNPLQLSSSARSSVSSTYTNNSASSFRGNAPPLPPLTSPRGAEDVAALERRLTHHIMLQLRHDLGRQLEDVLSEKDATIAALRRENDTLRKALDRAQRENGRSDSSPSRPETEGRRTGVVPTAFDPPSPSILHEQSSPSVASLSSISDDIVYHVV